MQSPHLFFIHLFPLIFASNFLKGPELGLQGTKSRIHSCSCPPAATCVNSVPGGQEGTVTRSLSWWVPADMVSLMFDVTGMETLAGHMVGKKLIWWGAVASGVGSCHLCEVTSACIQVYTLINCVISENSPYCSEPHGANNIIVHNL